MFYTNPFLERMQNILTIRSGKLKYARLIKNPDPASRSSKLLVDSIVVMAITCSRNVCIQVLIKGGSTLAAFDIHATRKAREPAGGSVAQPATLWLRAAR